MVLPREITARRNDRHGSKLGNMLRMLSSNNDGDILTTVHSIRRLLQSHGADIHALAAHVEHGGGLSDADKRKIESEIENARAIGYAEGVRAAEARFRPPMASLSSARWRCSWSVR